MLCEAHCLSVAPEMRTSLKIYFQDKSSAVSRCCFSFSRVPRGAIAYHGRSFSSFGQRKILTSLGIPRFWHKYWAGPPQLSSLLIVSLPQTLSVATSYALFLHNVSISSHDLSSPSETPFPPSSRVPSSTPPCDLYRERTTKSRR